MVNIYLRSIEDHIRLKEPNHHKAKLLELLDKEEGKDIPLEYSEKIVMQKTHYKNVIPSSCQKTNAVDCDDDGEEVG